VLGTRRTLTEGWLCRRVIGVFVLNATKIPAWFMYTTSLRSSDPEYSLEHSSKYVPREASSCDLFVIMPYSNGYTDLRLRTAKNMVIVILASWKEPLQTRSRRIEGVETPSRLFPKPSDQSHQRILNGHDETGMLASGRRRDRTLAVDIDLYFCMWCKQFCSQV
jgi:hypothetical protein